jgi:hypothetical protein
MVNACTHVVEDRLMFESRLARERPPDVGPRGVVRRASREA